MLEVLKAPFPWFGGKSRVAPLVWERLGNPYVYIEPFFGSGAVLLGRPHAPSIETVNDKDGYLCNVWRAIQWAPDEVAKWADWPANESDLHARHVWLLQFREELPSRLEGDPEYFNPKVAGWWLYGMANWIGGEFCSGKGPWQSVNGKLVKVENNGQGVRRKLLHLGDNGRGVRRRRLHLSPGGGIGVMRHNQDLYSYMQALSNRMKRVRVCCGDWKRVCTRAATIAAGLTGIFLDPPYSAGIGRDESIYTEEDMSVAREVAAWAITHGDDPLLRIAVCGYDGEHVFPDSWAVVAWQAHGGYGLHGKNYTNNIRERIWFSPHCLQPGREQLTFF